METAAEGDLASDAVVLGGRYELRSLLGTGGSGAVHRARDLILERDVAVKVLHAAHDDLARARLREEARLAAALAHPGIARLIDVGEDDGVAGSTPYLVMEYVEGRTLRDLLRSGARLSVEQTLGIVAQVADAIAAVHAAGIVHRDLKPGNIMLTPAGRAVLLDFGIARHHDGEPLTLTGTIVGTVDYISPEQASGATAGTASDVYALGMVAYECLTGLRPLTRDTQVSTLMAHATTPVPSLPPTFARRVRDLVAQMVALEPAARPAASAIAVWARELLKAGLEPGAAEVTSWRIATPRPLGVPEVVRATRRRHLAAAGCALVAALVAGAVLAGKGHTPEATAAAATGGQAVTAAQGPASASPPDPSLLQARAVAATVAPTPAAPTAPASATGTTPRVVHHHAAPRPHKATPAHGRGHAKKPHGHGHGPHKHR